LNLIEKLDDIIINLPSLAAEIFLALSFVLIITVELILFRKKSQKTDLKESNTWLWGFSLAITVFAGYITINQPQNLKLGYTNSYFIIDNSSIFFKIIVLIATIITLFHIKLKRYKFPNEIYPLLILQLLGLFLLTISVNFLLVYISIEIVSIASYVFAAISLNKKASEASLKYALFGGVSSAIMLYGISLLYGVTGTLNILNSEFSRNLNQAEPLAITFIILLTFGGFLFKISSFPFHIWVPDVYEATPTPIVSFMAIAPKAAGFLAIIRLISVVPISIQNLIIILSISSIAIGNFSALRQNNVKRMLAYSTIAQSGFILAAVACLSTLGLQSVYFYIFGYVFSNMVSFYLIDLKNRKSNLKLKLINFEDFGGLGLKYPIWGLAIVITMVSLIGLPPTVGFSGKLFIFSAIYEVYQLTSNKLYLFLLIFGLINTAISLYFYLKLPFYAFFREKNEDTSINYRIINILFTILLIIPILFYFFKADVLMNWIAGILK
jgi:NADH-quinone oxidoreductase subunit N